MVTPRDPKGHVLFLLRNAVEAIEATRGDEKRELEAMLSDLRELLLKHESNS